MRRNNNKQNNRFLEGQPFCGAVLLLKRKKFTIYTAFSEISLDIHLVLQYNNILYHNAQLRLFEPVKRKTVTILFVWICLYSTKLVKMRLCRHDTGCKLKTDGTE